MSIHAGNGKHGHSAADIFNSAVAATAIGAAWELGGFEQLHQRGVLDIEDFAAGNDLDPAATTAMFRALASVGVVIRESGKVLPGPGFDDAYRSKALFYWLCQGSWELFARMPALLRNENRTGAFHRRDQQAISRASREANTEFFDPLFWRAMATVGSSFSTVADLGSGSGERLIKLVQEYPGARGIGLDISAATIEMSTAEVTRRGLAESISFLRADVRELRPRPEFAEVELLTCFMMGHDLWPKADAVRSLRLLRELFPNVKRFLLGDTVRTVDLPDDGIPVFTLGFETGHALMGVYLPTADEWGDVFDQSGWNRVNTHTSDALAGTVVFELV
ncbi:cyclopropane-fatty-acyl-phospholipid synthase family protein [Amycolatopsis sp. YIM 10]|uniref:SAM-dependent methyltransferase n=1 Tax=Amycolatopsis sp. YIM 10 TaxID=2653857 RepID=UPI0012A85845|nr:class I SAM-dependent methyltransferase [Amycolatopsis sp. YIM 10]QFU89760.1 Phenylpyruvate C(3)-methyltransferase [Amycolatopsis sp. YIM 10]